MPARVATSQVVGEVVKARALRDGEDDLADDQRDRRDRQELQAFDEGIAPRTESPDAIEDVVGDAADHEADREIDEPGKSRRFLERRARR